MALSESPSPTAPSDWVRRFVPLIRGGGHVLDLAAGEGRHTRYLRELGFRVTAVDRDVTALTEAFGGDPDCTIVAADLEIGAPWKLGANYDGIVVTKYLHRPLFSALSNALAEGGVLIYETFMRGNEWFGKPSNPEFLLKANELFDSLAGPLSVIAFEQGRVDRPKPAMMQRIAAVKADMGRLPD